MCHTSDLIAVTLVFIISNANYLLALSISFSSECTSVLEDKLSEVSTGLLAAYDSGELVGALEEGHSGWQKWVKSFGKSLKRKVSINLSIFGVSL